MRTSFLKPTTTMLKSAREIDRMRKAGLYVWHALQIAERLIRPGITTGEVDAKIEQFFDDHGVVPLFKGVPGKVPFPAVTCISVNEQVVHGIPGDRVLREGDIVGVDTGCKLLDAGSPTQGWCGDAARTFAVGKITTEVQRLMDVTEGMLNIAIEEMGRAATWSAVAKKMQALAHTNGFSVIEDLVGHGIGREMHEDPQVPNYVSQQMMRGDFKLVPGIVLAVEPMVNVGTKKIRTLRDHWTIITSDHKPSAHFEHTLALTSSGVRVLTGPPENDSERIDISKYA
ncbi:MAG: type I methionyl aminopeptidase [Planctomycetaceae bacterium]|jgi:methionyl aminopeptidase|nr:type I methionyl aminopeptidase [Planctomycetaceae bacterium]